MFLYFFQNSVLYIPSHMRWLKSAHTGIQTMVAISTLYSELGNQARVHLQRVLPRSAGWWLVAGLIWRQRKILLDGWLTGGWADFA